MLPSNIAVLPDAAATVSFYQRLGTPRRKPPHCRLLEHRAILLSEDIWLMRLFGDQMKTFDDYIRFSKRLKTVVSPLSADLLNAGHSVVLDFQANAKAGPSWFRSVFEQAWAAHALHFVSAPDEICLARIARRNVERPEGSRHLTEEDFFHVLSYFQAPEETEGFNVKIHAT